MREITKDFNFDIFIDLKENEKLKFSSDENFTERFPKDILSPEHTNR